MSIPHRSIAPALILALFCTAPLSAQVVVEGGAPNGQVGWQISGDTRLATAFTIGSGGVAFDGIRFWGIADVPYSPDIYWQILGDASGAPNDDTIAAEGHAVATGSNSTALASAPGYSSWQFDLAVGPQSLPAGTFWLALHDGVLDPTGMIVTSTDLYWESTDDGPPSMSESISASTTLPAGERWGRQLDAGLAFELVAAQEVTTTPEPASLLLVATGAFGVMGAGLVGRKHRRKDDCVM